MARLVIAMLTGWIVAVGTTAVAAPSVFSTVEGVNGGVVTSDPQGPSGADVMSHLDLPSTFTIDFSQTGFGEAAQRIDGVGAVLVDANFANGMTGNSVEARTTWTETVTNGTGGPLSYVFSFLITPPSLRIVDFAGLPDAGMNQVDVSYRTTIRANGVVVFESEAHLLGGNRSHALVENGTSLGPAFVNSGPGFGYDFQPYSDDLGLGVVASGASMTVEYEMVARLDTPGFEAGGRAAVGDPFDLEGSGGISGEIRAEPPVATESRSWGLVKALY